MSNVIGNGNHLSDVSLGSAPMVMSVENRGHNGAAVRPQSPATPNGVSNGLSSNSSNANDSSKAAGTLTCLVGMSLAEIERHAVLETLAACDGNKAQAARLLGVSEKTIYNKLKQYRHEGR